MNASRLPCFFLFVGAFLFLSVDADTAFSQAFRRPRRVVRPVTVAPRAEVVRETEQAPPPTDKAVSKGIVDEDEEFELTFAQTPDELVLTVFAMDAEGNVSKGFVGDLVKQGKKTVTDKAKAEGKKLIEQKKKELERTLQNAIDRGKNEADKTYQNAIKSAENKANAKKREVDALYRTALTKAKNEANAASRKTISEIESKAKNAIAQLGKTEKDQKKRADLEKKLKADLERAKKSAETKQKSAVAKVESEAKKKKTAIDNEYKKLVSDAKKSADKYKKEVAARAKKEAQSKLDVLNKQFGFNLKI